MAPRPTGTLDSEVHLKRFFGRYRLDEIDGDLCLEFKAHKLHESRELREALQAGADLRDARNRRVVPLGAASLKKLLTMLAVVLGDAIEDGHLDANPARSRRLRIHVPKPKRTFLEVYAQLQQRARRENGARFDALVHNARQQLTRRPKMASQQSIGPAIGSVSPNTRPRAARKRHRRLNQNARISRRNVRLRNSDLHSEHHDFQGWGDQPDAPRGA